MFPPFLLSPLPLPLLSLFLIILLTRPLAYPCRRLQLIRVLRSQHRLLYRHFSRKFFLTSSPLPLFRFGYYLPFISVIQVGLFFAPPCLLYHTLLHDIMHSMVLRPCRALCCCRLCAAPGLALLPLPGWASLWQSCALSTLSSLRQAKID